MAYIALLHHRKHPSYVKKAYPFAAVAKMEEIEFYYFSYRNVDFISEKINGWVYDKGSWVQKLLDFPRVIINASNPKTDEQKAILNQLKKVATITSHSVGNKMKVYNKILKGKKFANYLIPSLQLQAGYDVLKFLEDYPKVVVKPILGNHGKNIVFIEKMGMNFKLTENAQTIYCNKDETVAFIENLLMVQKYLLQPYIHCKTKLGLSFDFRLHIQKNGQGAWEVTLIYPRISGNAKLISNISNGGYRGELRYFLKEEYGDEQQKVKHKLEMFALSFADHFDTLYPYSFDELGIDIGMDENQKIWIFEVNWRPGCKHREFEVAKRLIPYCRYLSYNKNS